MIGLKYTITTQQPLLITSLQGDPNSSVSFDYIPGSAIRGALIGLYQQKKQNTADLLADPMAKRLFFSPQTRFLNGYCTIGVERCLPLPKSLRGQKRTKPSESGLWDSSTKAYCEHANKAEHRSCEEHFGWLDSAQTLHIANSVKTVLNIHTARDRQKGRATSGSGAVFRYEAIAPGQGFIGYILCESVKDAAKIQELLTQPFLWLGGSRSAGYGKVRIKLDTVSGWTEYAPTKIDSSLNTITLLSDMLIRDQQGQYTTDLAGKLGLKLVPEYSNIASTIIGGFNRKWGLPLPQVPAIAMGSVFVVEGDLSQNAQTWLEQGIGERRNEGFGRIAINWRPQTDGQGWFKPLELELRTISDKNADQATQPTPESSDNPQLKLIKERIIRQCLDQRLVTLAQTYTIDAGSITSTQLARLWLTARNSLSTVDRVNPFSDINQLITSLPSNAKGQFERTKLEILSPKPSKKSLYDWLDTLNSANIGWSHDSSLLKSLSKSLDSRDLYRNLIDEYTLRLVMLVAKQARNMLNASKQAKGATQQ